MKHVVVVGGGIVGITTAWALLEAGHRVTLLERASSWASGASGANGGQLSYRYVSPLADAGVPLKALQWLADPDGPLRFQPEVRWRQWSWLARFISLCRRSVNQRTTEQLLRLGALSQRVFADLAPRLEGIQLRAPGKLVVYRDAALFAQVRERLQRPSGAAQPADPSAGVEIALDATGCVEQEPALEDLRGHLAGGIFTPSEAVADCQRVCADLGRRLREHPHFEVQWSTEVRRLHRNKTGAFHSLELHSERQVRADACVMAAGLQSRDLLAGVGVALPIYPLKGYSLTAPIGPQHRAPEVSVTDFEKKILYARIGSNLRVAAMVDLVGEDLRQAPDRLASLQRAVRATFPRAADFDAAIPWTGLRPATPGGAPILGPCRVPGLWLNVGHGALGFTFSFGSARIVAELVSGRESPLPLDGLRGPQ